MIIVNQTWLKVAERTQESSKIVNLFHYINYRKVVKLKSHYLLILNDQEIIMKHLKLGPIQWVLHTNRLRISHIYKTPRVILFLNV